MDRPLTPSRQGDQAVSWHLENITRKEAQAERDAVLAVAPADIRKMEKLVSDILKQDAFCVYGNEEKIESQKELFGKIVKLEK